MFNKFQPYSIYIYTYVLRSTLDPNCLTTSVPLRKCLINSNLFCVLFIWFNVHISIHIPLADRMLRYYLAWPGSAGRLTIAYNAMALCVGMEI